MTNKTHTTVYLDNHLRDLAKRNNLNFSQLLTNAIELELHRKSDPSIQAFKMMHDKENILKEIDKLQTELKMIDDQAIILFGISLEDHISGLTNKNEVDGFGFDSSSIEIWINNWVKSRNDNGIRTCISDAMLAENAIKNMFGITTYQLQTIINKMEGANK